MADRNDDRTDIVSVREDALVTVTREIKKDFDSYLQKLRGFGGQGLNLVLDSGVFLL